MKIVYVNDQIFPCTDTDAEQIMQTVSTLSKNGADVDLILPKKWGSSKILTIQELESHYQLKLSCSLTCVKSFFPSFRLFEKNGHAFAMIFNKKINKADVVYTRNIPTLVLLLLFSKVPLVYETFRPWPDQIFYMKKLFKWIGKKVNFAGMILHSDFAAQSYRKIGLPNDKIMVAHNGYNPEHIEPRLSKFEARKKLGLSKYNKIAVYTGNVSVKKGCGLILDMAEAIKDTQFIIIGSKSKSEIENRAENIENVMIVPWQSFKDTAPYRYAADVLIIPPTTGPLKKVGNTVLPIKTFLYLATGRVIFGPDSPDLAEILENEKNAILVEPDNLNIAISTLTDLLNDHAKIERISEHSLLMSKELTYSNRSARILKFIESRLNAFHPSQNN